MSRNITPASTLDSLKAEARRWLKALKAGAADARARLQRALPGSSMQPTLRDVQHALAREFGLPGWTALKQRLAADAPLRRYDRVAEALVAGGRTAYSTKSPRSRSTPRGSRRSRSTARW